MEEAEKIINGIKEILENNHIGQGFKCKDCGKYFSKSESYTMDSKTVTLHCPICGSKEAFSFNHGWDININLNFIDTTIELKDHND